jgi:hypothetical protein
MKANEAPEKIYLFEDPITGTPDYRWLSKRSDNNDIEYTRTDAFIEKTEKWLNEHILDYVYAKEWGQGVGVEGELFDDLKEYIKGE